MSAPQISLVFDGRSATLFRKERIERRRWLGIRAPEITYENRIVAVFPCPMALSYTKKINNPSELHARLANAELRLRADCG